MRRSGWVATALALVMASPAAWAQAGRSVLVAEPQADAELETLAAGAGLWLIGRIEDAGLDVATAPPGVRDRAAAIEEAIALGASYALLPSLRLRDGRAEVRMRLFAPGHDELVAAARASAPLATLGEACEEAAVAMLVALGVPGSELEPAPPPALDSLAASGRALGWIDRGDLERAWREVEGKLSPTAMDLRKGILDAARSAKTPKTQRARVLAASGDERTAWRLIGDEATRQLRSPQPDREILLAAADIQLARNNARAARKYLDPLAARGGADGAVQLRLGVAFGLQNDRPAARQALRTAARLDSSNPRPLLLLAENLDDDPAAQAEVLLEAGEREARSWSLARAERDFKRAEELAPELAPRAAVGRARMHQDVGREAEAVEAWHTAIDGGVNDADSWAGLGAAQRAVGDAGAEESLRKALEIDPGHAGALTNFGRLHTQYGRAQVATTFLRRAVAADPGSAAPRRELSRALAANGETEAALASLVGPNAPTPRSAETLREAAALQRELGDLDGAQQSLRRAVALEPDDAASQHELARVREALGDASGASEARQLAALLDGKEASGESEMAEASASEHLDLDELVLSFSNQVARPFEKRVALLRVREHLNWRALLRRWVHPRTADVAAIEAGLARALEQRFERVEVSGLDSPTLRERLDRLFEFESRTSLDAQTIADVNSLLEIDAVFATRLLRRPDKIREGTGSSACADPKRFEIEVRMLAGQHADMVSILTDVECVASGLAAVGTWNHRAFGIYGAALLLLVFPMLRGWGTLVVEIKLPPKTRGFLNIHVSRRAQEASQKAKKKASGGRLGRSLSSFSRFRKNMAGRETVFRWVPARARAYYVTVSGPLFDALGDEEIGNFLEEQRVKISRGKTERLSYDFNPEEVAVQVEVLWNGEPAQKAQISLRDDPGSLRYARNGNAFFYCRKGVHTLCIGVEDRATERPVEVKSLEHAVALKVDLGRDEGLLVRGARDAVEPYLLGDFATAATALEDAGEEQLALLMRGAHHQQRGEVDEAAVAFEAAGCIEEAAELRASGSDHQASASLFEQAGDFERAADAYREAGALDDAGRCYESAHDYVSATECFEAAGNVEKVIDLHEKTGAYMEAATLAHARGAVDRALQNLQHVDRRDPSWGEACRLSAEIFGARGEFDLAAEKMGEAVEQAGGENAPVALLEQQAGLLEQAQDHERALTIYELVRRREPGRSEVTQHIETLRQELSTIPDEHPDVAESPAAVESRYEILGELGRGGMGVVFKARDTRLGRIVALKRLPENLRDNQAAAQLFLREARAAAALNHPNIVTVYDADEENGVYHITMELLEGLPINAIQERRQKLTVRDVVRLGVQVCAGLQYAHERRIVHRDIKTANLFFTQDKVVKIMDFGLAKMIEEVRKGSTVIGGTPYYMAPEQALGEDVDNRTDLYALGVTFYRLLTGSFPFSEGDLAYHHRHTPPPDPREHDPELPAPMAELLLRLLAKDPDARPSDASEVGTRLREILS